MNKLYVCLILVLITQSVLCAQTNESKNVEVLNIDELYSPKEFKVLTDSTLIVIDEAGKNPAYLVNFVTGKTLNRVRYGRGPGELTWSYKNISLTDNQIMIWDSGLNAGNVYDYELNFKGQLSGDGLNQRLYQLGFINDTTIYFVDNSPNVLKTSTINNFIIPVNSTVQAIDIKMYSNLSALENILLKQTFLFQSDNDKLYWGFEYSSYGYSMNLSGEVIEFSDPVRVELPFPNSTNYTLPDIAEHPVGMLDILINDRRIVTLYQGRAVSKQELLQNITDYAPIINKIYHSTKLNFFNLNSGAFIESKQTPIPIRKIEIYNGSYFGLNTLGEVPKIYKFALN